MTRFVFAVCLLSFVPPATAQLAVVTTQPAGNSLTALPGGAIEVTFDRPINRATVGADSFWAFGRWSGLVSGAMSYANGDTTVRLTPTRSLSAGESVLVVLSHDLRAMDGNSLRSAGYSFQFWVRSVPTELDYEPLAVLLTGNPSRPYGAIGSDLDGDGDLDITTVNEDTDDLRVFRNDGAGNFADFLQPTAGTGDVPSPSEPIDFDRDGNIDIALANTRGNSVSILLGQGDGSFGTQQQIALGGQSRGIAVLDVDGDGDADIAATDRTGQVAILTNDGSGTFGPPSNFATGGNDPWALGAGDMNGDGILDLVVGDNAGQQIEIFTGNGDGTFTAGATRAAGGTPWMLVLGDVDGNGTTDVAVANTTGNGAILLGNGFGGLAAAQTFATDPFALATDLADLDGDGDLDWIVAAFGGDWSVFRNDAGSFAFAFEIPATSAASCSIALDFDNDGTLDLALIDELANEVIVLRNSGGIFVDGFESGNFAAWSSALP